MARQLRVLALLQRTRVQFPAAITYIRELTVIGNSVSSGFGAFFWLLDTCALSCAQTHRYTNIHELKIKSNSQKVKQNAPKKNIHFGTCMCIHLHAHIKCAYCVCMWTHVYHCAQGYLQESALPFLHVGTQNGTQIIRLGSMHLNSLSHLEGF